MSLTVVKNLTSKRLTFPATEGERKAVRCRFYLIGHACEALNVSLPHGVCTAYSVPVDKGHHHTAVDARHLRRNVHHPAASAVVSTGDRFIGDKTGSAAEATHF